MKLKLISASEAEEYQKKTGGLFIDLRDEESYRKEHIPGAVNVPYRKLERYAAGHGRDRVLILYCDRGVMSLNAGKYLAGRGWPTAALAGGMNAYRHWRKGHQSR